jgi:hypothetical protein
VDVVSAGNLRTSTSPAGNGAVTTNAAVEMILTFACRCKDDLSHYQVSCPTHTSPEVERSISMLLDLICIAIDTRRYNWTASLRHRTVASRPDSAAARRRGHDR